MPFEITAIRKLKRAVSSSPKPKTSARKAADVFYEIDTAVEGITTTFQAEIRAGNQVDWSDAFQELMMAHSRDEADWSKVSVALLAARDNQHIVFPIWIGQRKSSNPFPKRKRV